MRRTQNPPAEDRILAIPVDTPGYALLGGIDAPTDLRRLPREDLPRLALELRRYLIETLARSGGHFSANLGTVELSLALHYVFDTPHDRLVWDVGHQAYPHKLLTGRRAGLETMRRSGGLAPFLSRTESVYDAFGAGHALNHIGALGLDVLVVCNDNDMSISENVGALREHTARALARAGISAPHAQRPAQAAAEMPVGALFETLGFTYHGPVDGHDSAALLGALETLKDAPGPRFLHAVTVKGRGFAPAEAAPIRYHGVTAFDPVTGELPPGKTGAPGYSQIFGDWLCEIAASDARVVAITPAMREGSGLAEFSRRFPERCFDVGIAEQHAVTLAAGLACEGLRPVVAIYSTFLQRAYDQLIHDVAIQKLPVLFAIDRGGLVGADGATHHGAFDLSYLRCIPNLVVMTPSDENECRLLLATGLAFDGPAAVRYPRGSGRGAALDVPAQAVEIGRARRLRQPLRRQHSGVAFLAFGSLLQAALEAAEILDATVVDMRFVKPLDSGLILELAQTSELLVTLEDNARLGGAGSGVNELLAEHKSSVPVLNLGLPDRFVGHGSRQELLSACGLDAAGILRTVQKRLRERGGDRASSERRA